MGGTQPALSFRGVSKANEPGIQYHLWIPGLRAGAHPGMTMAAYFGCSFSAAELMQ